MHFLLTKAIFSHNEGDQSRDIIQYSHSAHTHTTEAPSRAIHRQAIRTDSSANACQAKKQNTPCQISCSQNYFQRNLKSLGTDFYSIALTPEFDEFP